MGFISKRQLDVQMMGVPVIDMSVIGMQALDAWKRGALKRGVLSVGVLAMGFLGCGLWGASLPALAAEGTPNGGAIRLQNGVAEVRGVTSGERSLAEMAGRDRRRKVCLGYAAAEPDHTLILTQPQPRLRIAVSSEGQDTTLLVEGPRGIDCNDNYRREHRDAAVTARNWPAGEYRIWVGAFDEGDLINYRLRITNPSTAIWSSAPNSSAPNGSAPNGNASNGNASNGNAPNNGSI